MIPVNSNIQSKSCDKPISSDCIQSQVPAVPCLSICAGASQTDVDYAQSNAICGIIKDLSSPTPTPTPILDFSAVDLGCLYQATLVEWVCPIGQEFIADSGAFVVNGTPGYCQTVATPHMLTTNVPVMTTTPNPTPKPTTLAGILNLIISKTPCCDPCKGVNIPPGP